MDKKHLKKRIASEQKNLIRLLNKWDPLGVLPFDGGPVDEYECFVGPIISLLHKGKGKEEINSFLNTHLQEHMGLGPKFSRPEKFVDKIMDWWNQKIK